MSIQELLNDLKNYPRDKVRLEVVDFDPPGEYVNTNETSTFQIRIRNIGSLDMDNVRLHMNRKNGTELSQSDALGNPFNWSRTTLTTDPVNVPAYSSATTRTYYVRTGKNATKQPVPLFEVHIAGWDARMDTMLRTATQHSQDSSITFDRQIHPS